MTWTWTTRWLCALALALVVAAVGIAASSDAVIWLGAWSAGWASAFVYCNALGLIHS